jgi:outer membrane receptor protein involved in Fe transport
VKVALLSLMLAIVAAVVPVSAQALAQSYHLNIPRQPLDAALKDLAQQTGLQIARFSDTPGGSAVVGPVSGDMSVGQALTSLLGTSGLTYKLVNDHTIAVVTLSKSSVTSGASGGTGQTPTTPTPADGQKEGKRDSSDRFLVAQAPTGQGAGAASVTTATTAEHKTEQLQEVLVTAERREATVLNTPISITAVSGEELQTRGVTGLYELGQSIPGVALRTSGPGQTEFEMRGMASTGGNSPTVGFYLDDVPLSAPAFSSNGKVVIDPNLYDINRVEVLRGPQGTLYGSGSMGGTIKVITNAPNPKAFDASGEAILSNTDGGGFNYGANGMLNIPMAGNTVALRLVGSYEHTSGWIDRIVIAEPDFPLPTNGNTVRGNVLAAPVAKTYNNVNDTDLGSLRAGLLWAPNDRFSVEGSYFYQRISQGGTSYIDSNPGTDAHYQPFDAAELFEDKFNLGSLDLRYRFDNFDVTSVTSLWKRSVHYPQDGAEEWQWALVLPSFYTADGGIGATEPTPYEEEVTRQLTEELRFTSTGSSAFQWLAGYFYSDFTSTLNYYAYAPGAAPLFGTQTIFAQIEPIKLIQNSFFADLTYHFSRQLKASVGVRRYHYNESVTNTEWGFLGPSGTDEQTTYYVSESHSGINPRLVLSYEPNDNAMVYGSAAKGFRPGGGTGPVPISGSVVADLCESQLKTIYNTTATVSPVSYDPDSVWTYEIGEKMRLANNRLTINGAAYFSDWTNIQQLVPLNCGFIYTANAGDAHVYGGELEINAALSKEFTLSVNGAYTHAQLVSSNLIGVGFDPGTPVQQIPEWTSSQWLTYRHSISAARALTAHIENHFVGSRTDATFQVNHLPSYDLTDVRAGVEGEKWSANVFATNVFNKRVPLSNVFMISVNVPMYNRQVVPQPLTIGLDITYSFGK